MPSIPLLNRDKAIVNLNIAALLRKQMLNAVNMFLRPFHVLGLFDIAKWGRIQACLIAQYKNYYLTKHNG